MTSTRADAVLNESSSKQGTCSADDSAKKVRKVLLQSTVPALAFYLLLPASFYCPWLDSTSAPFFDLTSQFATVVLWVAHSGGRIGASLLGLLLLLLLSVLRNVSRRQRWKDFFIAILLFVLFAGGGAFLNEHFIKPTFGYPRPNIQFLCGKNGGGPLKMTTGRFYAPPTKAERRVPLRKLLSSNPAPVALTPDIRDHWVWEVGYSFPSGHAFASMLYATLFSALAVSWLPARRSWLFFLLLPWAVIVCWSRLILRVHTPLDITAGGLQGIAIGFVAFLLIRAATRSRSRDQNPIDHAMTS